MPRKNLAAFGFVLLALAAEELILRGVIQRAVEQELAIRARVGSPPSPRPGWASPRRWWRAQVGG